MQSTAASSEEKVQPVHWSTGVVAGGITFTTSRQRRTTIQLLDLGILIKLSYRQPVDAPASSTGPPTANQQEQVIDIHQGVVIDVRIAACARAP